MMLDTVKIAAPVSDENPLGYIVINQSDLAETDVLFVEPPAYDDLNVSQIKELLTAKGVAFDSKAVKADLLALLKISE